MKVGIIGAGTMGQGIAKAFAQVDGYEVALCDIKQEWAQGGKDKIAKGYAKLVEKGKLTQEAVDAILRPLVKYHGDLFRRNHIPLGIGDKRLPAHLHRRLEIKAVRGKQVLLRQQQHILCGIHLAASISLSVLKSVYSRFRSSSAATRRISAYSSTT